LAASEGLATETGTEGAAHDPSHLPEQEQGHRVSDVRRLPEAIREVEKWLNAGAPPMRLSHDDWGDSMRSDLNILLRIAKRVQKNQDLARDSYIT
jgi:hypothetical protein